MLLKADFSASNRNRKNLSNNSQIVLFTLQNCDSQKSEASFSRLNRKLRGSSSCEAFAGSEQSDATAQCLTVRFAAVISLLVSLLSFHAV